MKRFVLLVLLCLITVSSFAQTRRVTGRVIDSSGDPVPGVSLVAGTFSGTQFQPNGESTTTNYEGRFTLRVPPSNGGIKFSYIGMIDQIVHVPNGEDRDLGDIVMSDNDNTILRRGALEKKK